MRIALTQFDICWGRNCSAPRHLHNARAYMANPACRLLQRVPRGHKTQSSLPKQGIRSEKHYLCSQSIMNENLVSSVVLLDFPVCSRKCLLSKVGGGGAIGILCPPPPRYIRCRDPRVVCTAEPFVLDAAQVSISLCFRHKRWCGSRLQS